VLEYFLTTLQEANLSRNTAQPNHQPAGNPAFFLQQLAKSVSENTL